MNRVLVTGGAGFIGSHLCKRLIECDNYVICVDNLFTGNMDNIKELLGNPGFEFVRHDTTEQLTVDADKIYNLACPASPVHYQHYPVKTLKTSLLGSINVLENAKRLNARVLHASTSEVYGDPLMHPQKEVYWGNVNPIGIRACYDEGKRAAEALCFDYHRQYGVEIKVARFFNTYGPNIHPNDGRVISNFITQALSGNDITIHGDGSQTRSFCYVDDLIDGVIKLMDSPSDFTGPVNLGNPVEFTIYELAALVVKLAGSKSKLVFHPLPQDDPKQRKPDITLAREKLNWEPRIPLEEGLVKTIDYFKDICV